MNHVNIIAHRLSLPEHSVSATIELLEGGATIPFISRYRKEATGSLDEVAVGEISQLLESMKALDSRRDTILETIEKQGNLTPELKEKIERAEDPATLEDLYLPFKPKRRSRATVARERGLEPLARILMAGRCRDIRRAACQFTGKDVADADAALQGAADIVAEWVNENESLRRCIRNRFSRDSVISSSVVKGKENEAVKYEQYFDFSEPLRRCSSHRYLAMRRGENEGLLKVSIKIDDDSAIDMLTERTLKPGTDSECAEIISGAVADGYRRLMRPSIENETGAIQRERADDVAIKAFADNVEQLLMAPPLGRKRVLAIDPGFRTGCKIVCLDEQGNLLHNDVIYPTAPQCDTAGSARRLSRLVESYRIEAISLGNGTASRETEQFIKTVRFPRPVEVYVVSENGASVYSASKVARDEFPDKDVTVRGAVSIGRRLIDPLAELVKIDPKSIGVGQYQHDVDQTQLKEALDRTVMSCVNRVGVNVNTASPQLLSYVSGIGQSLAENIVKYRAENGDFKSRPQLKKVPRLGDKAYEQCAAFLRIPGAENPLDNSAVHPESYHIVKRMAADSGCTVAELVGNAELVKKIDISRYVTAETGLPTLTDIVAELEKPGRDPRNRISVMEFDDNVRTIEDLRPGMELNGIVNNITEFGAFVDIGLHESGLVHISQMADRRIASPRDVVKLHQHVRVRVLDVDVSRRRISLTMKGLK